MPNNFSLVVFLIIDCTTRISKKYRRYWQSNGICWCFRLTDCQRTIEKSFAWRFLLWSNQAINIILHKKVLLSAKPVKSVSFTRRNKSLRKISNNNDPRTGPCGTLEQRFPPWTIHMASSCTLFFVWKMILDLMLWGSIQVYSFAIFSSCGNPHIKGLERSIRKVVPSTFPSSKELVSFSKTLTI